MVQCCRTLSFVLLVSILRDVAYFLARPFHPPSASEGGEQQSSLEGWGGSRQTILLARGTRTIKECSFGARILRFNRGCPALERRAIPL